MSRLATLSALFAVGLLSCNQGADFYVRDTGVVVATSAPFAVRSDFPARIESTVDAALAYWGGTWADLAHTTITFEDGPYVSCAGSDRALGCYDGNIRLVTKDPGVGTFSCVEETVLVHEIGHAVIGDRLHQDPRWMDFEAVAQALQGRMGYSTAGEVPCQMYLSVWRHLPANP